MTTEFSKDFFETFLYNVEQRNGEVAGRIRHGKVCVLKHGELTALCVPTGMVQQKGK